MAQQQAQASDVEQIKMALAGMIGQSKQLEGRVLHLECQVAAMMERREHDCHIPYRDLSHFYCQLLSQNATYTIIANGMNTSAR